MSNFDYQKFFPHEVIREEQKRAIEFALNAFINENKRFVVLEMGTGCGKSAVGLTISRFLDDFDKSSEFQPGGYFVTTQKVLQDQYENDFGFRNGQMRSIKSSSNYSCKFIKSNSCAESRNLLKCEPKDSAFSQACTSKCTYVKAKIDFVDSRESVTNFPYFLTETNYHGGLKPRKTLVIDEAHNIENELSKFIEVSVSERFAKKILKIENVNMQDLKTQKQAFDWIQQTYFPSLALHINHINKMLEKFDKLTAKISTEFLTLQKQIDMLNSHKQKIEVFLSVYDKENWVLDITETPETKEKRLEFKPIDISHYAESYLLRLGKRVLFMSATILNGDTFCEALNIKERTSFMSIPSPFPRENRPIIYTPIGSMSKDNIDKSLPQLANAIKEIIKHHKNEKGIIHCQTYKIAQFLKNNIKSERLLIHNSENREQVLKHHLNSKDPTIILSPSMTEGIDLKGEYSRFQIICKIPYPYLGDKLCRKRMNKWKWWYGLQTAKTLIQAVGRSIRSMDDYAVTYILDADWSYFSAKNSDVLPEDFVSSIVK